MLPAINHYRFQDLLGAMNPITIPDLVHHNKVAGAGHTHMKRPLWAVKLVQNKVDKNLPPGVKFIKTHQEKNPDTPLLSIYQEVLLSFFGNGAKGKLVGNNWSVADMLKVDKDEDCWKSIAEDGWTVDKLFPPVLAIPVVHTDRPSTVEMVPVTDDQWITWLLNKHYGYSSTIFRPLVKLMFENKIPVPEVCRAQTKVYCAVDPETHLILDPLAPAPAAPVSVKSDVKKNESEPEPAFGPESPGLAQAIAVGALTANVYFATHDEITYTLNRPPPWARIRGTNLEGALPEVTIQVGAAEAMPAIYLQDQEEQPL